MLNPLTQEEKIRYSALNKENIEFLMNRYNRVNRWVIADMIRRTRYHYPDKKALIFGDQSLTYTELEDECNRVANALSDLGVEKYDRVAILAHNTIHQLAPFKVPKKVVFVDALPKTPTGKILKREMRISYKSLFSE